MAAPAVLTEQDLHLPPTTTEAIKGEPDEEGRQFLNQYRLGSRTGKGQHGLVYRCWDVVEKREVAIKAIKRTKPLQEKYKQMRKNAQGRVRPSPNMSSTEQKIMKEIAIMRKCRHAHVVELYEIINDRDMNQVYIVMEYLGGGEIKWRNDSHEPILTVSQIGRIIRDVILGLEYLHYQGIIHRDIKPANLLWTLDRSTVKITDFGVSHCYTKGFGVDGQGSAEGSDSVDDSELTHMAGTPPFMAPEIVPHGNALESSTSSLSDVGRILNRASSKAAKRPSAKCPVVTKANDVWSLGITLYCLLFGTPPFDPSGNEWQIYRAIATEDWPLRPLMGYDQLPSGQRRLKPPLSREETVAAASSMVDGQIVVDLLERLLEKNPAKRITLDQVKRNPWFLVDILNPEQWIRATSMQEPIVVTAEETTAATTRLRFRWPRPKKRQPAATSPVKLLNIVSQPGRRLESDAGHSGVASPTGSSVSRPLSTVGRLLEKGISKARPLVSRTETTPNVPTRRTSSMERARQLSLKVKNPSMRRGSGSLLAPPDSSARKSDAQLSSGLASPTSVYGEGPERAHKSLLSFFRPPWGKHKMHVEGPPPHEASTSSTMVSSRSTSGTTSPLASISPQSSILAQLQGPLSGGTLTRRSAETVVHSGSRSNPPSAYRKAFGHGPAQFTGEQRASSYGEMADYDVDPEDIDSGGEQYELDEWAIMIGAGGVSDVPPAIPSPIASSMLGSASAVHPAHRARVLATEATSTVPDHSHPQATTRPTMRSPLANLNSINTAEFSDDDAASADFMDQDEFEDFFEPAKSANNPGFGTRDPDNWDQQHFAPEEEPYLEEEEEQYTEEGQYVDEPYDEGDYTPAAHEDARSLAQTQPSQSARSARSIYDSDEDEEAVASPLEYKKRRPSLFSQMAPARPTPPPHSDSE